MVEIVLGSILIISEARIPLLEFFTEIISPAFHERRFLKWSNLSLNIPEQ